MGLVRIAVLVSGGGSNLQSLIDKIHGTYGEIVLVASNRKNAYGLERAKKAGIAAQVVSGEDYDEKLEALLREKEVDLVVLAGYLKKISPELVGRYKNKIINIHPSLIPSFSGEGCYGLKVHEMAVEYGVKISGATVHFVDENMDTGAIIAQRAVEVDWNDTPESLQAKVLKIEHEILAEAVKNYCLEKITVNGRIVAVKE
ncbi:phosphoribosylglycinamide formyltransferase [Alkalibacter mobilis]|uniref:phosphoribosylglycinamide formyltransferase n=1 Tax=Alkalibacter mobilis TaxID=2787712 RepID=UPI00189D43B6|nr:phosphoribosylglycinamide formyltransferase [Alkalibacter mobilis]MBF7096924.1 phosphoribosylglycinamide formyltransferase [Alkalibacter mobilis]